MRLSFSHSTPEMINEAVARLGRALQTAAALSAARQARDPRGREHLVQWRFAGNPSTIEGVAGPGLAPRRPMRQRPNRAVPVSPAW